MKKIKIGIIGAGRIGKVRAQSITYHIPLAEVAVISDIQVDKARSVAEQFSIPTYYSDYQDILQDPAIDAVLICAPTNLHADISIQAAKVGKHVFCEKPIDLGLEKIIAVKRVVEKAGIKMQIGFNRRFDHNFWKIRKLVETGELGSIQIVKITSRDPNPPSAEYSTSSGGLFLDMTIHDFDMARYLTGDEIIEVFSYSAVLVDPAIGKAGDVDTAVISLKFANGALGVIDNCRKTTYGYDQRVEILGSEGMAIADNDAPTNVKVYNQNAISDDKPLNFFLERYMQSYITEMQQFISAISEDKPVSVNIDDGLKSVTIALAAQKSAQEKRPVHIDEIFTM